MRDGDDKPADDETGYNDGQKIHENRFREVVRHDYEYEADNGGYEDADHRHAAAGERGENFRRMTVFGQTVEHAARAVQDAVISGKRSDEYDEV